MAYGGRKRRQRNALDSIHDPPDPSPRSLPDDVRADWDDAYEEGYAVYEKKDLAKRAAWREVSLNWRQTGKKTWSRCRDGVCYWPPNQELPMPRTSLFALGVLVEYVYLDKKGKLRVSTLNRQRPPLLWWDDGRKALYAFPKQPYPTSCTPIPAGMDDAVEIYERWHQRKPQCYGIDVVRAEDLIDVPIPDVTIRAVGAADSVSYASDKWEDRDPDPRLLAAQEYIHDHWYDVWVWTDTARSPNVILIQGGELEVHEKGLIH